MAYPGGLSGEDPRAVVEAPPWEHRVPSACRVPADDHDTEHLIARVRAGEAEVFAAIYLRYFDGIYGYVLTMLGDPQRSEAVTQEVFGAAFGSLRRYRTGTSFRVWLFARARTVLLAHLRQDEATTDVREPARGADESDTAGSATPALNDPELLLCIGALPVAERQVLALRYLMGMTTGEIAAVLNRSERGVRQLQHRGVRALEARLTATDHAV